jgi:hypothetical protein
LLKRGFDLVVGGFIVGPSQIAGLATPPFSFLIDVFPQPFLDVLQLLNHKLTIEYLRDQ